MKNIWTIICQFSSIDQRTNQLSAFNILDGITFVRSEDKKGEDFFVAPINFQLISFWMCDDKNDKGEVKIKILDPDDKKIEEFNINIHPVEEKLRIRNVVDFNALKITKQGIYNIVLTAKNKSVSKIPLDIKIEYKDKKKD